MDLKSSSLGFCKHQASVVPHTELGSRASSDWAIFRRAAVSGFLIRFAVLAMIALPAASLLGEQPNKIATRVNLSASTSEGTTRTQATFTAQVAATNPSAAPSGDTKPTGSVSFMIGDQSIGAAFLDSEGRATYTADALPLGPRNVTAVYVGDSTYQAATSEAAAVNSEATGVPGFTLSASNTSLKVVAGQAVSTVITATPENGFNAAVSLSCSGVPYVSVSCIFSPAQVTPGAPTAAAPNGVPALSTLTMQTIAPSGVGQRNEPRSGGELAYAVVPGILALAGLGLARRRGISLSKAGQATRMVALLLLLVAGGMGLGGCAQRYKYYHKPPQENPGTPLGTYTVVISGITGTGSSLSTASVQFTLTVTGS
jgi:hypothetical protein